MRAQRRAAPQISRLHLGFRSECSLYCVGAWGATVESPMSGNIETRLHGGCDRRREPQDPLERHTALGKQGLTLDAACEMQRPPHP